MKKNFNFKPYVVFAKLRDGSVKLCSTYGRAFVIPQGYATLFEKYMDYVLMDDRDIENSLAASVLRDIKILRRELLNAGIIEKTKKFANPIRERYKSQMTFFSIFDGKDAFRYEYHRRMGNSTVALLGMGGMGCHVANSLSLSGIGSLKIVDYDVVERSNLNRQILYNEKDVGKPKVKVAKNKLREVNPHVDVQAIDRMITCEKDLKDIVENIDFFVCAADYPFHYIYRWVNKICVCKNISWIQANFAEATGFVGPLIIPRKTCCYGCIEEVWRRKNPDYLYEIDTLNADETLYHEKSSTLGAAVGILGNLAALEIIKHITGFAKPLTYNCQLSVDFGNVSVDKRRFRKVKDCPVCKASH